MLLEIVTNFEIAVGRGVEVPSDRMTPGPITVGHRSDVQCHANAIAGIVTGTANLCQFPTGAEIAGTHFCVRFKATCGKHYGFRG